MKDFTRKGVSIGFFTKTGTVMSSEKRDKTSVYSTGGGSVPTQVHSVTVTKHDLWLKQEDGEEDCVRIRGADVPVRVGQKVTAVYAGVRKQQKVESGYPVILVNHDAHRHWMLESGKSLIERLKFPFTFLVKGFFRIFVLPFALFALTLFIAQSAIYTSDVKKQMQECFGAAASCGQKLAVCDNTTSSYCTSDSKEVEKCTKPYCESMKGAAASMGKVEHGAGLISVFLFLFLAITAKRNEFRIRRELDGHLEEVAQEVHQKFPKTVATEP